MRDAYIAIGNSDDKLTQAEWSLFSRATSWVVGNYASQVYFHGYALPHEPWQNMSMTFSIQDNLIQGLKRSLTELCARYGQDSIAFSFLETEMIGAAEGTRDQRTLEADSDGSQEDPEGRPSPGRDIPLS